jgi:hypothetical protein
MFEFYFFDLYRLFLPVKLQKEISGLFFGIKLQKKMLEVFIFGIKFFMKQKLNLHFFY